MIKKQHLFSAIVILLFVLFTVGSGESGESDGGSKTLNASASFTGTQFVIINSDSFDYPDATITINGKYRLNATLQAGETYTVGMMQFADRQGTRFSINQKPLNISISCRLEDGSHGFYHASWN